MQTCPSVDQLRQLLSEPVSARDEAALTAHLEVCAACQQLLEQLTDCRGTALAGDAARPPSRAEASEEAWAFVDRFKGRPAASVARPPGAGDEAGEAPPQVSGYELLELIGRGSSGSVYKARDQRLNRLVALKLFGSSSAAEPERRARIHKEAEAAARLQHPHVVQI